MRQHCAEYSHNREIHRLFHKTVEKQCEKILAFFKIV